MATPPPQTPPTDTPAAPAWHAQSIDAVLTQLGSQPRGLSVEEAQERLQRWGPNRLPDEPPVPVWLRFLRQFHNLLIYVLLGAAAVTTALGDWIETGVILAVVLVNAIIGSVQEGRAEAALASLRSMLALHTVVLRGGKRLTLSADQLVPGDVVLLESGDRVPADARIIEAHNLSVEEAALTGESIPASKRALEVARGAGVGDRTCMLYAGTTVTSGAGRAVVVATGSNTEVGRIGELVSSVTRLKTPLLAAIDRFSRALAYAILGISTVLFAVGYFWRGYALDEIFLTVIGFAVAAIPEGLPAVITIILALGVQRMARERAIVRRLPAVETLGAVNVICSDKTGTLTRNEMTVRRVVTREARFDIAGEGYQPRGDVLDENGATLGVDPQLRTLAWAAALTAEAEFDDADDGTRTLSGDPTDGAVVVLAEKLGFSQFDQRDAARIDKLPFESDQQYAATLSSDADGQVIFVKGAPERLLNMCAWEQHADGGRGNIDHAFWEATAQALAADAYRLLAVAVRRPAHPLEQLTRHDVEKGLTMLGIVALMDPPREESRGAVKRAQAAGVRVVMITGDHALTAQAIARRIGLARSDRVMSGGDLDVLDPQQMEDAVANCDVFARASPEHKLRLLEALQRRGAVAAMTGDGVNDAPALKRADVGIAMGVKGSEAAKDASEMVLADDNFATITRAIEEGRTIYDNLKKTILFILPTNGAEALVVMASVLVVLRDLPITPVQILWINMITAVTLALALAFEPPEANVMHRPPRERHEPILSRYLLWRIGYVSVIMAGLTLWVFFTMLERYGELAIARSIAVNTLVAGEIAYLLNTRFLTAPALTRKHLWSNPAVYLCIGLLVVFQLLFTYTPAMQTWFGVAALKPEHWLVVALAGVVVFVVIELEKWLQRTRNRRAAASDPTATQPHP